MVRHVLLLAVAQINHRIRSMKLTREDVAALASPPFSAFVDQTVLRTFHQVD